MNRLERLEQMVMRIGKLDEVMAMIPDPAVARVLVHMRDGSRIATFDLPLEDLEVRDDLLEILLEDRLSGVREWAYWETRAATAESSQN